MSNHASERLPGVRESLRYDLPAGLVVFLVAVPLCLGIALASGAPPIAGLVAGMVGGLVVPLISRAQLSVCGPAAGLAAVVVTGIATVGSWQTFLVAAVLSGLIQVAMGVLRLGKASGWAPTSVVGGMLAAIGILLIMKQIPHAFGIDADAFVDEGDGRHSVATLADAVLPLAMVIALTSIAIWWCGRRCRS